MKRYKKDIVKPVIIDTLGIIRTETTSSTIIRVAIRERFTEDSRPQQFANPSESIKLNNCDVRQR